MEMHFKMKFIEYIKILKACDEEPGPIESIVRASGFSKEIVEISLLELGEQNLTYKDKENYWAVTDKGVKLLGILGD